MTIINATITPQDVQQIKDPKMGVSRIAEIRDKMLARCFPGLKIEFSGLGEIAAEFSGEAEGQIYELFHRKTVDAINRHKEIIWVEHDCSGFPHWFGYGPGNVKYSATKFLTHSALADKYILFRSEPAPTSPYMSKHDRYTVMLSADVKKFAAQHDAGMAWEPNFKSPYKYGVTTEDGGEVVRDLIWSTDSMLCYAPGSSIHRSARRGL